MPAARSSPMKDAAASSRGVGMSGGTRGRSVDRGGRSAAAATRILVEGAVVFLEVTGAMRLGGVQDDAQEAGPHVAKLFAAAGHRATADFAGANHGDDAIDAAAQGDRVGHEAQGCPVEDHDVVAGLELVED